MEELGQPKPPSHTHLVTNCKSRVIIRKVKIREQKTNLDQFDMNLHPMGNLKNGGHCLHHPMIHAGQEQGHDRGIDVSTETPSRNKTRREDKTLMNAAQSRPHRPKKSQISPKMSQTLALNPKMSGRVEKQRPHHIAYLSGRRREAG